MASKSYSPSKTASQPEDDGKNPPGAGKKDDCSKSTSARHFRLSLKKGDTPASVMLLKGSRSLEEDESGVTLPTTASAGPVGARKSGPGRITERQDSPAPEIKTSMTTTPKINPKGPEIRSRIASKISPLAQELASGTGLTLTPLAREPRPGTSSKVSPLAQETKAGASPLAQETRAGASPLAQETRAGASPSPDDARPGLGPARATPDVTTPKQGSSDGGRRKLVSRPSVAKVKFSPDLPQNTPSSKRGKKSPFPSPLKSSPSPRHVLASPGSKSAGQSPQEGASDLSAFAMPLLDGDSAEMSDSGEFRGRPRSSSGSSALKGLLGGKAKHRNKSSERDDKDPAGKGDKDKDRKADKDGGSKVKSFFDTFRPRSKSDASALQRPKKKPPVQMEHSMDESSLSAQVNNKLYTGSQEVLTPMGQILEGQMLNVPDSDPRIRHKSGPQGSKDGFMSKFRTRSNSDSKPKSPRKPLMTQKSLSPPNSPRLADRSGLSPLRLQSGEPRSAPPGMQRSSLSGEHTHAIIYKSDVLNRLSVDSDRMEIEDLDENEDLVFAKFMKTHKCYDLIPTSAKLVIFDTQLNVKKAFFALVYNGVRAAPLWDSVKQDYVGMLTITDFINILKKYYKTSKVSMEELEDHRISTWRDVLKEKQQAFVSIGPDASLFEAVKTLVDTRVHRLPVIDETTGNALHILTHKRLLRFLHLYIKDLPQPSYMKKSIKDLGIGTYENIITVTPDTMLIKVLNLFAEHRISALPVVDNNTGRVISIYAKFDVIHLAAERMYNNLEITLGEALKMRQASSSHTNDKVVATCHSSDSLERVLYNIVKAEVHRLVVVDESEGVEGIVSLSDLLNYTVLRPMAEEENGPKTS